MDQTLVKPGPGAPLSPEDRAWYGTHLGADFTHVRLHQGAEGAQVTRPLGAAAVTKGLDVYLSPEAPARGTEKGERLVAHEMVHAAQFLRGGGSARAAGGGDVPALEREAAAVSSQLARGGSAQVMGRATSQTPALHQDPPQANAPPPGYTGVRVTGWRTSHMAAVGMTIYFEIELPIPLDQRGVLALLFENSTPAQYSTVAPLPQGSKAPSRTWLIGGRFYAPLGGGKSFLGSIKEPFQSDIEAQWMKLDKPPTQPAWFSQATVDHVRKTGMPPAGASVKLSPGVGSTVYVWVEKDVWYWYNTAEGDLQAFYADPSKTGFGEKMYTNWVVGHIATGKSPKDSMDQAVKEMMEANIAVLGAFGMAMASARPISRPPASPSVPLRVRSPNAKPPPVTPPPTPRAPPRLVSSQRSVPPPPVAPRQPVITSPGQVRGNTALAPAQAPSVPAPAPPPPLRLVPPAPPAPAVPAPAAPAAPRITGGTRAPTPTPHVPPMQSPVRPPFPRRDPDPGQDPDKDKDKDKDRKNPIVTLRLPSEKAVHLALYYQHLPLLQHKIGRWPKGKRATTQRDKWDKSIDPTRGGEMTMENLCWGLALDDRRPGNRGGKLNVRAVIRPTWDATRFRSDMDVDHRLEMQLAPIANPGIFDEPWNYELLDDATNSDAGWKLDANMVAERSALAAQTNDPTWLTKDILQFHTIVVTGSPIANAGRWSRPGVVEAAHLHVYQVLTGESADPAEIAHCRAMHGRPNRPRR